MISWQLTGLVLGVCWVASLALADSLPDPVVAHAAATRSVSAAPHRSERELVTEFPSLRAISRPPYRVLTDQSAIEIEPALRALDDLQREFAGAFGDLIVHSRPMADIEVVFFGRAKDFRRYTRAEAPALETSAGYYSARHDRLILVKQVAGDAATGAARTIPPLPVANPAATTSRLTVSWSVMASPATVSLVERVIRHEGAHQLFCHYRIHSAFALEPTWISEGLAEYCVPAPVGDVHPVHLPRLRELARQDQLLSLGVLLNHRDPVGFFAFNRRQAEIAYAQSWGLVHYLMQSRHRAGFFNLLRLYRDTPPATARSVEDAEPRQLLFQALGISEAELEREWQAWLAGD